MSELLFGVCAGCGCNLIAPGVKFPIDKPTKTKGKPGFYDVSYVQVCDKCAGEWIETYSKKLAAGDFMPDRWVMDQHQGD